MRILFWGTPDFAVPALRALLGEGHDVVGVVTQPDRPRGRSRSKLDPSPVKLVALEDGVPVLQPEKPRGGEFLEQMRALEPEISVVVAYGHILPREVIDLPMHGTLNIHASLLPKLRGAAPIQAAILQGLTETGVTIMQMVPQLDAGDMLHVVRTPIPHDETYGELHERLAELGALGIVQALALIEAGAGRAVPQDHDEATYASKITREATRIAWDASAVEVSRTIRAFDPTPGALTVHQGADVKCFGARLVGDGTDEALDGPMVASDPGTVRSIDEDGMLVRCRTGAVKVTSVKPAGRQRMSVKEWERGRGIAMGDMLG